MAEKIDHPLRTVSHRIFDDWAMMIADEVPEKEAGFNPEERLYMAWVNIHGHIRGALSILASESFARKLATNLLGAEEESSATPEVCEDALREMANVLAGNYFTEAYGEDVVFDLINPNVVEVPFAELESLEARRIKYYFRADDSPVAMTFNLQD